MFRSLFSLVTGRKASPSLAPLCSCDCVPLLCVLRGTKYPYRRSQSSRLHESCLALRRVGELPGVSWITKSVTPKERCIFTCYYCIVCVHSFRIVALVCAITGVLFTNRVVCIFACFKCPTVSNWDWVGFVELFLYKWFPHLQWLQVRAPLLTRYLFSSC